MTHKTVLDWNYIGKVDGGQVWEQNVFVSDGGGYLDQIRRVKE